jgi:hypothetical protein
MAGVLGGPGNLGGASPFGLEPDQAPSLGRISGKLLSENLLRNGVDLAFNTDLLYLKVSPIVKGNHEVDGEEGDPNYDSTLPEVLNGSGIGINTDTPGYELEINGDVLTRRLIVDSDAYINNFYINNNRIGTTVGNIEIFTTGSNGSILFDKLSTANLLFDGNKLTSTTNNTNILFNPSGTGTIELQANTNVTGNLNVTGAVSLDGNLRTNSNIIIGDEPTDVVEIGTDLTQDINPGLTLTYNLGSVSKRWAEAHITDWRNITTIRPDSALVSEQTYIGGPSNQITTVLSNEDLFITPSTGVTYVEQIKIEGNNLTNLVETPELDPTSISNSILSAVAGNVIDKALWIDNVVTGIEEIVTGPGSTSDIPRTASLGDIRNDQDNFNIVNADDAQKILDIGLGTGASTNNEQRWYHTVIKPYIFDDPVLYTQYGNGAGLDNTPLTIQHTGTGYLKFTANDAFRIPAGTTAERQYLEIGETRWNTDLELMECFDGDTYIVATGPGAVVTNELMIDLAISRALTFG